MAKITYLGCEKGERGELVKFDIDGRVYEYDVGFYFMEKISNLAQHAPGRAHNIAKQAGTLIRDKHKTVTFENGLSLREKKS